jgi:hypothetical protein
MSKMYVFAIGGSGSRVLKSLTMLLAAGVKCDVDTIVPIILDKDVSCFNETKELIENYITTQEYAPKYDKGKVKNRFFNTKLKLLNNNLVWKLENEENKFKKYINYNDLSGAMLKTKALVDVLFSKNTLEMSTSVGFQGNPNVGSVVLNQFSKHKGFKTFGEEIDPNDKIFIISSIFGGTGASGFPILLKTLNNPPTGPEGVTSPDKIKKAAKGAITILPYFKVSSQKEGDNKDSLVPKTFIPGTKAALHYYETLDKKIDSLYYIGEPDELRVTYKHEKGGSKQEAENKAHIVELAAALAVIDFANNSSIKREPDGVTVFETTYKEFGIGTDPVENKNKKGKIQLIETNDKEIGFNDLPDTTKELLKQPLLQLLLMRKYVSERFQSETGRTTYLEKLGINNKFFSGDSSIKSMLAVLSKYYIYLQELESGKDEKRKFNPFSLETDDPFKILKNETVKTGMIEKSSWTWFLDKLNQEIDKVNASINETKDKRLTEKKIVELFYRVSEQFYNRLNQK